MIFARAKTNLYLWAALALVLALYLFLLSASGFLVYDDAFITFRYAENLFDGCGIRFNCGEERVEGYSNFLWMVLLTLSLNLSEEIVGSARLLGTIFGVLTLVMSHRIE